jgi:hypothetical protein
MKVRLEKQTQLVDGVNWYAIYMNDEYIKGSYSIETAQEMYDSIIKNNGKLTKIEVLAEERISGKFKGEF